MHTVLNPEELLVTQKRAKVATGRWRVKKMRQFSGSTSSSELLSQHTDSEPPYKSPASFGKAKRRAENVENVLPISPRKRVTVVRKLANDALQVKLPALSSSISSARNAELETAVLPE